VPDEFNGRNPKKLKSFLVSCNNTFRTDPNTFHLHDKHVSYALSYLRGSAQCHFDTQLKDEDEVDFIPPGWLHDWPRFVEELCEMFVDPNTEATAEAELDGLHMQTNQKFADFLVDFNTLSSQVNWGDHALHHRLKQALPNRIKDSLVLVEEPAAFNEWKRLVQNGIGNDKQKSTGMPAQTPVPIPVAEPPCPTRAMPCREHPPPPRPAALRATPPSPATSPRKAD
jgi:hypothetical protein